MKPLFVAVVVVAVAFGAMFALAQEEEPIGECDQDQYNEIADFIELLAEDLRNGEYNQESIIQVQVAIGTMRAFCEGYTFTSEDYGIDVVTDVIVFRDGTYRGIFDAEESASLSIEEASGDCDFAFWQDTINDEGPDQELVEFEDCVGIIEVSASAPWTFVLEPIVVNE